jgi:glycosyltransferase involved in cell wall biosynthesis
MEKLSIVIITYNEEKNIESCLKSVINIADEIVVLDSFSTDNTKQICEKYNVSFYEHKFDGHIQQKNRALFYAGYDYVLSLDADERLTENLRALIKTEKQDFKYDAYYFNRLNFYCKKFIKHSGWYPDRKLRLWNKNKGKWGGTNPHDKVIMNKNAKIKYLKADLLHYTFYTVEQHLNQINKFTEIGANEAYKKGKKSNIAKILIKSIWKFFRNYFIKLGFLDGYYGFVVCSLTAQETFIKYVKLKEFNKDKKQ